MPVSDKHLLILIDGFGLDYLTKSEMPNLRRLMAEGNYHDGLCVLPSVTNVNNTSVVTGSFPEEHGVVSNFAFDPQTRSYSLVESAEVPVRPTLFERVAARGLRGAMVSAKDKVRTLLCRGAVTAFSAEVPDAEVVAEIGPPPGIYTAGANHWTFRAARYLLRRPDIDWLYLSTTDYMMHTYTPEHEASQAHLQELDRLLGQIVDDHPKLRLGLTADHGMNAKTRGLDLAQLLAAHGIAVEAVPIIRDKHVVHHGNLGGACYIYFHHPQQQADAIPILAGEPGVEEVHPRAQAAAEFHLRADRIGDLFVLGDRETVFGALPAARSEVTVRSHGSRHEQPIPLLLHGPGLWEATPAYNLHVTQSLLQLSGC